MAQARKKTRASTGTAHPIAKKLSESLFILTILVEWWLLRRQAFEVARRGWFVYANGQRDRPSFDGRLEFTIRMIPYDGDDGWVEATLAAIRETLMLSDPPPPPSDCEFCSYAAKAAAADAPAGPRAAPRRRKARGPVPAAAEPPRSGDLFSDSAPPPVQASRRRGA